MMKLLGTRKAEFDGMEQKEKLEAIVASTNVLEFMTEDQRNRISEDCRQRYKDDRMTMKDWLQGAQRGMKMTMQLEKAKEGRANIQFPIVAQACIAFNSRAYPTFVKGNQIAQPAYAGDRVGTALSVAKRVAEHMSYTALHGIEGWTEELDRMFQVLPNLGMCYKKTWWDPIDQCIKDKLVMPQHLTLDNDNTKTIDSTITTEDYTLSPNEIREREAIGVFEHGSLDELLGEQRDKEMDEWEYQAIREQHTWLDLDGDGVFEPYIVYMFEKNGAVIGVEPRYNRDDVKVDKDTDQVVNVVSTSMYTPYGFIPSFDGKFLHIGFGHLIGPLNSVINTIYNQLLDAGTNSNFQGGFISSMLNLGDGPIQVKNKHYIPVDAGSAPLSNSIFPFPVREPSAVLFQLLGFTVDLAKNMTSTSDIMTGQTAPKNVPATTVLAMIEQGMVMMTAIYKRIYRSMTKEINIWMKAYRDNMTTDGRFRYGSGGYFTVQPEDYKTDGVVLAPVADPNMSSQIAMIAKARALIEIKDIDPNVNTSLIIRYYIEALAIDNLDTDAILPENTSASPAALEMKRANDIEQRKLELENMEQGRKNAETVANLRESHAKVLKMIAEAESQEGGTQLPIYKAHAEEIEKKIKLLDQFSTTQESVDVGQQQEAAEGAGGSGGELGGVDTPPDDLASDEEIGVPEEAEQPGDVSGLRGPSGRARPPGKTSD